MNTQTQTANPAPVMISVELKKYKALLAKILKVKEVSDGLSVPQLYSRLLVIVTGKYHKPQNIETFHEMREEVGFINEYFDIVIQEIEDVEKSINSTIDED